MSKYTPEQVLHAADLEQAKYDGDLIISGYLRDYAALLRERESDVPEGMAATKLKPPLPKSFLGTEDFCFCDSLVSLQGISGDGAPEGYLGSVRLKVNGKFVTYVRECKSAKAGVTEEVAQAAYRAWCLANRYISERDRMRSALEAVAPMLASAKQPIPMILHCPSCHTQHIDAPETTMQRYHAADIGEPLTIWNNPPHRSHLCHKCGTIWRPADVPTVGVEKIQTEGKHDVMMPAPVLASARVPESEWITELRGKLLLSKATHVFSFTRNEVTELLGGLAAAPRPETEE